MSNTAICLRSIADLLSEQFYVPSYQRGYRWTRQQVEELLDDIWDFQNESDSGDKHAFYCLQPIVVKCRDDGSWELVDGQQRLTTIHLILTCLDPLVEVLEKRCFRMDFETRSTTSGSFLDHIDLSRRDETIDFHHIANAYEAIEQWFGNIGGGNHKLKFLQCLLNDDEIGRNVKIIWYELPPTDDPIAAFTRLNVGKIPLTDSELIRALFLRSDNFDPSTTDLQRLQIAQEWDGIEKSLQSDSFWHFLHKGVDAPPNRIEYLFHLIASEESPQSPPLLARHDSFHFYHDKIDPGQGNAAAEWLKVKQYFMTLEEWFQDRELYHLIGFLIHDGDDIRRLRALGTGRPKSEFRHQLVGRIFARLIGGSMPQNNDDEMLDILQDRISDLEYGVSSKIRSYLLLFNIATLIENRNSNMRFPFDLFTKQAWDIEHVRSVESGKPTTLTARKEWLTNIREYFDGSEDDTDYVERADSLLTDTPIGENEFDHLYMDVLTLFDEADNDGVDNAIGNLALLDSQTNRSYKNAVFPVKRERLLGLDREGTFVPLCTKNAFLKCYSRRIKQMFIWSEADATDYQGAIVRTLARFFGHTERTTA